jgi:hypothetical protein
MMRLLVFILTLLTFWSPALAQSVVSVAGFDQAAVTAAINAAGTGGEVIFPPGTYVVDGLNASYGEQTWRVQGALTTITRSSTSSLPLLNLSGPAGTQLHIRGGIWDGNRAGNPSGANCADGNTMGLDFQDATLQNCPAWGSGMYEGELVVRRSKFINNKLADIIWRTMVTAGVVQAPVIEDNLFDHSMQAASAVTTGAVLIGASNPTNAQRAVRSKFNRNRVLFPQGTANVAGIEGLNCGRGWYKDNTFIGGGTGISNVQCGYMEISGNQCQAPTTYCIELGGDDLDVHDNLASGLGPSLYGIFVNTAVNTARIHDNHMEYFTAGGTVVGAGATNISAYNND